MKVAIIGYGIEGRSALAYWQHKGADITVCDRSDKIDIPAHVNTRLGSDYLKNLDVFDVIMRTASVKPGEIIAQNPGLDPAKITTVVNEFLHTSPTKNIIGVTGTKGKGTTCMLISKMLEGAGKQAYIGGNYGTPPFDFLDKLTPDSWVVLELSSFMLQDIKLAPHIAVCLMVYPEHLDWHGNDTEYIRAKTNLFALQTENDVAIYFADNLTSHQIASASPGDKIAYFDEPGAYIHNGNIMIDQTVLCKTSELKLLGEHNWQNVCAAVTAVWQVAQAPDAMRKVLTTFAGLPHRLELVRENNGVRYYNDSFASDPYASEAAISAVTGIKVLILGGYDGRRLPLERLAAATKKHERDIRTVILIGESAKRMGNALKRFGFVNLRISPAKTMTQIVAEARAYAQKGDAVVLSPGFPSFDMFKNFEVRGLQFKEAVHEL